MVACVAGPTYSTPYIGYLAGWARRVGRRPGLLHNLEPIQPSQAFVRCGVLTPYRSIPRFLMRAVPGLFISGRAGSAYALLVKGRAQPLSRDRIGLKKRLLTYLKYTVEEQLTNPKNNHTNADMESAHLLRLNTIPYKMLRLIIFNNYIVRDLNIN